jgi:hypothetical protein
LASSNSVGGRGGERKGRGVGGSVSYNLYALVCLTVERQEGKAVPKETLYKNEIRTFLLDY